jgi:hypothetical protein
MESEDDIMAKLGELSRNVGGGARGLVIFNYLRPFAQVKAVVFMLSSLQNRTHDHMKCNVAISQRASVASGQ